MSERHPATFGRLLGWMRAHPVRAAALAGWGQQAFSIGGSIFTIPLILHRLGDATAGLWFSLLGFITLFSLADFGFTPAISRQVAHSLKRDPNEEVLVSDLFVTSPGWAGVAEIYAASRVIFRRVNLCALVLLVVAYELILPLTPLLPARTWESALAWYLLGVATIITFHTRLSQAFLDGLGFMHVGRSIAACYQLFWNLLSILALLLWPGLLSLSAVFFLTSIAQYWAMHSVLRHFAKGRLAFDAKAPSGFVRRIWRTALPFGFVSSGGYLESAAQIPLLGAMLGPTAVAPYYIAQRIAGALSSAVGQIMTSQWPFFTQECAQGHWRGARMRMRRTMLIGLGLDILTALAIYFLSPWLVKIWVGPGRYLPSAPLLAVAACYLFSALAALPVHFVLASGRNPFALSTFLHGVFTILGVVFLCPRYGVIGVPLASIAAGAMTNYWFIPWHGWLVWRDLKSRDRDLTTA